MKLEISEEWCRRAAEREGDCEVGAGFLREAGGSVNPSIAWASVKEWLASYVWEEGAFGKYRDDVNLDGVMTAGEARALAKMFNVQAVAPNSNRRAV